MGPKKIRPPISIRSPSFPDSILDFQKILKGPKMTRFENQGLSMGSSDFDF